MISPEEALERLREGNRRFAESGASHVPADPGALEELAEGQNPFAVILGCSDSRVPAEIVFDQGLGDLFVIRVAGNIVAPSLIGSVEFAVEVLGTRLVVVVGHSRCGAVGATVDAMLQGASAPTEGLNSIVKRIRPALEPIVSAGAADQRDAMVADGVRANALQSARQLGEGSELIRGAVAGGALKIVAAEYDLATGRVSFLEE